MGPVVVSDIGGLGEIINHDYDGMKSYAGNPDSLADSVVFVLYNPEKAEEMKTRALEKVNKCYNWDKIAEETKQIYEKILEESKKINWKVRDLKSQGQKN
jgi:glycosyltransferase involved in cell wall biosynthesis